MTTMKKQPTLILPFRHACFMNNRRIITVFLHIVFINFRICGAFVQIPSLNVDGLALSTRATTKLCAAVTSSQTSDYKKERLRKKGVNQKKKRPQEEASLQKSSQNTSPRKIKATLSTIMNNTGRYKPVVGPESPVLQKLYGNSDGLSSAERRAKLMEKRPPKLIETTLTSILGICILAGVVAILADNPEFDTFLVPGGDAADAIADNILGAAVPSTASEIAAVALGEGISGSIGALSLVFVNYIKNLVFGRNISNDGQLMVDEAKIVAANNAKSSATLMAEKEVLDQTAADTLTDTISTELVADGDFFLTRAAVRPLLQAVGVPYETAGAASVILASVPYEIVKLYGRRERRRVEASERAEAVLLKILEEEEERRKQWWRLSKKPVKLPTSQVNGKDSMKSPNINQSNSAAAAMSSSMDGNKAPSLLAGSDLDIVEIFTDITKWLEYDVLTTDLHGKWIPSNSGAESAIFGLVSALSSQLYADLIYQNTEYGSEKAREKSRNRNFDQTLNIYVTKCVSSAALFGIYETVRQPLSSFLIEILSGGVDSCIGSSNVKMCLETYGYDNPMGSASVEAQIRALALALVGLLDRVTGVDELVFDLLDDDVIAASLRASFVSVYSVVYHYFPIVSKLSFSFS